MISKIPFFSRKNTETFFKVDTPYDYQYSRAIPLPFSQIIISILSVPTSKFCTKMHTGTIVHFMVKFVYTGQRRRLQPDSCRPVFYGVLKLSIIQILFLPLSKSFSFEYLDEVSCYSNTTKRIANGVIN